MSTTKPEREALLRVDGARVNSTWRPTRRVYDNTPAPLKSDIQKRVSPQQVALREAAENSVRRGLDQVAEGKVVRLDHLLDEE
jgi:hypothetical protein